MTTEDAEDEEDEDEGDSGFWGAQPPLGSSDEHGTPIRRSNSSTVGPMRMKLSPLGVLNLVDAESRETAGIPPSAFCYCCAHGLVPLHGSKRCVRA